MVTHGGDLAAHLSRETGGRYALRDNEGGPEGDDEGEVE